MNGLWQDVELETIATRTSNHRALVKETLIEANEKVLRSDRSSVNNLDEQFLYAKKLLCRDDPKSDVEAATWLFRAAENGHAQSQNELGVLFTLGIGVSQSDEIAYQCFLKAALQGIAASKYNLGKIFLEGRGRSRDLRLSFRWFMDSAIQGYALAQFYVAFMLSCGLGCEQNSALANYWLSRAGRNRLECRGY